GKRDLFGQARRADVPSQHGMIEATISLDEPGLALPLFGPRDQHLRKIRELLRVDITHRDGEIHVSGEAPAVAQATEVLEQLKSLAERRDNLSPEDVSEVIGRVTGDES